MFGLKAIFVGEVAVVLLYVGVGYVVPRDVDGAPEEVLDAPEALGLGVGGRDDIAPGVEFGVSDYVEHVGD